MINLGTVRPGSTIYVPFEAFAAATGAPVTITGLATSDIKVYKDGSTTERVSTAGFTLLDTDGIDFDSLTGIHGMSIDLSDNTTADFWAAGSTYFVVISDITVDGVTMRFIPVIFRVGLAGAIVETTLASLSSQTSFTLTNGPADDNALIGCTCVIFQRASAIQMCMGVVLSYAGASKSVGLYVSPGIFTIAAKDNICILPRVSVYAVAGLAQTARDLGASVLLSNGTGAGQVSLSSGQVTVSTNNDKTGYALSAAAVQAIWDALTSALTTVGSIGKYIVDKLGVLTTDTSTIQTNQATIINRIGAFTGSGINTILGFFKAAMGKTASTPSDVGGTFDATTDALEALRDRGDAAWGGGGGGGGGGSWDDLMDDHVVDGSFGMAVREVRQRVGYGKNTLKQSTGVEKVFDADGTTELLTITPTSDPGDNGDTIIDTPS